MEPAVLTISTRPCETQLPWPTWCPARAAAHRMQAVRRRPKPHLVRPALVARYMICVWSGGCSEDELTQMGRRPDHDQARM